MVQAWRVYLETKATNAGIKLARKRAKERKAAKPDVAAATEEEKKGLIADDSDPHFFCL